MSLYHELDRQRVVQLVWLYLFFLLVEGALRKWVLPSLSDPLMLIRDPIAVAIVLLGFRSGYVVFDSYGRGFLLLFGAFVALGALQLINGVGGSPFVIVYGLRAYFLHLPVAFVMARVLRGDDLRRMLHALAMVGIPMAILMVMQFEAPRSNWLNAGVGGHSGQIIADRGHIRPAGTFSYINGPVGLYALVLAGLIGSYADLSSLPWAIQLAGWASIAVATSVSGSRSFLAALGIVVVAGAAGWARSAKKFGHGMVTAAITAAIVVYAVGTMDSVQEGNLVMQSRLNQFDNGGLTSRFMYDFYTVEWAVLDSPPLGVGLGAGTNAAAAYEGTVGFRWGEGEWPRVIFEAGPVLGLLYMLWRVWITIAVGRAALRAAAAGALMPLLLLGACASSVVSGQWGQTTVQGFGVFTLGLSLAAGRSAFARRPVPVAAPRAGALRADRRPRVALR